MSKPIRITYDTTTSESAPVTFDDSGASCAVIVRPRLTESALNALVVQVPGAEAGG
jgi:hypothetical protein